MGPSTIGYKGEVLRFERGDLSLAENFLNQAHGLAPDDPFVETERAYLMFSQAGGAP